METKQEVFENLLRAYQEKCRWFQNYVNLYKINLDYTTVFSLTDKQHRVIGSEIKSWKREYSKAKESEVTP
jgi:hypothetical protein